MFKKEIFLFLIISNITTKFIYGETYNIFGRVFDIQTSEQIIGAKIFIPSLQKISITNDSGAFTIKSVPTGNYVIYISCFGYNSCIDTINISNNSFQKEYYLTPSIEDIEAVVITANRNIQSIRNTTILTQIIPSEQQLKLGNYSVISTLEREIAGLDKMNFGYRPKITFQGLNARYILFLIDGERIAGEMDGDVDYFRLNMDNVEKIEILRGPASIIYGSNAISGVINIITRQPQSSFETSLSARLSKYNETFINLYAGGRKNKLAYLSSFNTSYTDGYDLTPNEPYSKTQEKYNNFSFNQRFDYNFNTKLQLYIKGNAYYNRIYDGRTDLKAIDHGYTGQSVLSNITYRATDNSTILFTYAYDKFVNYNILLLKSDKHNKTASDRIHTWRTQLNTHKNIFSLIMGSEVFYEDLFSERIINQNKNLYSLASYVQNEIKLTNYFSSIAGIRAIYFSNKKFALVPALNTIFRFDKALTLRTAIGMGYRAPTLKEMYYNFDHMGMFQLIGNENLKSEKSKYMNISFELKNNVSTFVISAHTNTISNMISHTIASEKVFQYININKARIRGFDIIHKSQIVKNFILNLNFSYVQAINKTTNTPIYNIAPISFSGSLSYNMQINKKLNLNIDISDKFTDKRTYEPIGDIVYKDPSFHYWKLHTSLNYKNRTSIGLGVDNLFNNVMPNSLGNISSGRKLFFTFQYKFIKN